MKKNTAPLLLFLLISWIYFYRAFIYNLLPSGIDVYGQFYPTMKIVREQFLSGEFPFWNSYMFSGFPIMAGAQHAVLYPFSIFTTVLLPGHSAYLLDLILHYALAGFFTFLYARKIGIDDFSAFVAGILFAFMGYLMPHINHLSILRTATWIPLILYFIEDIRLTARVKSALLASLAIAMQVYAGHPQICFYTYLILLFYMAFYLFHSEPGNRLRVAALGMAALGLGLLIASPQLYATYQLSSLSIRPELNYSNFASFSFPISKIPYLFLPSHTGETTEGYVGWLPAILAITSFIMGSRGNIHVRFWGAVAVLSLALSLGDALPLISKLMYHVPIYNSFRGLSKHILEFSLALSLLSALGISSILSGEKARGYLSSILLLSALSIIVYALFFQTNPGLPVYGKAVSVFSMLIVLLLLAGVLMWRRYWLFKYIVAAAVMLELITFKGTDWIKVETIDNHSAGLFNMFAGKDYRVAFFADNIAVPLAMRHRINLVDGYDPLILKDYNTLFHLDGIGVWPPSWPRLVETNSMLSMMNTRFVVLPPGTAIANAAAYRKVLSSPLYAVYENLYCLPRAFGITDLIGMEGADKIRNALLTLQMNPASQAAVSKKDLEEIGTGNFARGSVSLLTYTSGKVILRTQFSGRGFVVLSDQYYPGWHAYIDDRPAKIYKTDGVLRGVVVPQGIHELRFGYQPGIIYALMGLSIITLTGTVIMLIKSRPSQSERVDNLNNTLDRPQ